MLRSMTGFGTASRVEDDFDASVTIRAVNHRYLEISVHLSRRLLAIEPEIKRRLAARFTRGKVEVSAFVRSPVAGGELVRANEPLVASLVETLRTLRAAHGLAGDVSVADVLRFPGALETEAPALVNEEGTRPLLELLDAAAADLERVREAEGQNLQRELETCLDGVLEGARRIEGLSQEGIESRKAALADRVREAAAGLGLDEARLHQEVVRLVERADVAEELARLRSHVSLCRQSFAESVPCGKRLDFLAQELMREANTIGSKVQDAAAVHEVVDLKAEIERLREQVQNVE